MKKVLFIGLLLFSYFSTIIAQDATISIPNLAGVSGSQVLVPINITTLNKVGSITLNIKFDASVMSFTGVVENNSISTGFFNTGTKGDTIVTVSWFGTPAINLGSKMFDLKFNYLGGTSPIAFDFVEVTNDRSVPYTLGTTNGSIAETVADPAKIELNEVNGVPGDTVSISISGIDLVNVGSMNLYIAYDTTKAKYLGLDDTNLPNFIGNAADGIVSLGMFTTAGFNNASGVIADIKFQLLNGTTDLVFQSNCAVSDKDLNTIVVLYTNGAITTNDSEMYLGAVTSRANENVKIPFSGRDLLNLGSFNIDIDFDETSLTFVAIHDSSNGTFTGNVVGGVLKLGYINSSGLTMSDNVIADLEFSYTGGNSDLIFDKLTADVQNTSFESVGVLFTDGSVTELLNQAPMFVKVLPDTSIVEMEALAYLYTGTDSDGDPLIFEFVTGPTGATIGTDGAFSWSTSMGDAGVHEVIVSLTDGIATIADTSIITVASANHAPYFTATMPDTTIIEQINLSYQYLGEDPDGDALTFALHSGPGFASISGSGTFYWTPAPLEDIVATIIVSLTDQSITVFDTVEISVLTDIVGNSNLPTEFSLGQNYPNPFNPSTTINYSLPEKANVNLTIYDITGQEIQTLLNSEMVAGFHRISFDASKLAGGVYLYRVIAISSTGFNFLDTKKMLLIK
jgi:Cohesin domain/Secretion system C-terminal sorting domain